MEIDWKSLIQAAVNRLVPIILVAGATYLETKWQAGADVLRRLNSGETVTLWHGVVTLSMDSIRFWLITGGISLLAVIQGWLKNIHLKRQANIALALPKGATKSDIAEVVAATSTLSSQPNQAVLTQVARKFNPSA